MAQATERVEVLVIGGGVIGSAIAYHVVRQGRTVLVVERANEVATEPAASWASAGGIRLWEQDPPEAALARAATNRWPALSEELDADIEYRQGGHLLLAENDTEAAQLRDMVQRQRDLGFADLRLMDRAEALSLALGLGEQVVAGLFSPASGQANPKLTTRAFAAAAERNGGVYWTDTDCLALERVADRVVGARTTRGNVQAEHVVLAAGAWSAELARTVGIELPLRMRALQAILSTPASPGALSPVLPVLGAVGRALSLRQLRSGEYLIGGGWWGDPSADGRSYTLREERVQGNWATACALFPPVANQRLARAWGGLQAHPLDDLPLIGSFSGLDGLTLAFGSWYGFALAPAIGRSVADHLAGGPTPELDQLRPDRIFQFDPVRVAAFLAEPA